MSVSPLNRKSCYLVNSRPVLWFRNRLALRAPGFNPCFLRDLQFLERVFRCASKC